MYKYIYIYIGCGPLPVTVTTGTITFLVGDPYKPSFATVTGWGVDPIYSIYIYIIHWAFGFVRRLRTIFCSSLNPENEPQASFSLPAPWTSIAHSTKAGVSRRRGRKPYTPRKTNMAGVKNRQFLPSIGDTPTKINMEPGNDGFQ